MIGTLKNVSALRKYCVLINDMLLNRIIARVRNFHSNSINRLKNPRSYITYYQKLQAILKMLLDECEMLRTNFFVLRTNNFSTAQ